MDPTQIEVDGARIAVWERPGLDPAVLFCHATGFHARCWDAVTDHLVQRSICLDMRGHGRSSKPEPPIPWRRFGEDVAAATAKLGIKGAVGVGHSMGGHSLALAAALAPEAFSQLVLIDPVILPEKAYTGPETAPHYARKRRNRFESWQVMLERYGGRSPYDRWDRQVLSDYCEYGLLPAPDGEGFVLACPPDIEGSIYEQHSAPESNIHAEIARVTAPVTVIRSPLLFDNSAASDMLASPTTPDLASRFASGRDVVAEYSHFIPMEAPEWVADQILRILPTR
ncbi:MAG: alpha/beta hydrolase [Acidobacteria bacterium]|nr:alpha/beta hydrolase [Acidobacteriota bacterium]